MVGGSSAVGRSAGATGAGGATAVGGDGGVPCCVIRRCSWEKKIWRIYGSHPVSAEFQCRILMQDVFQIAPPPSSHHTFCRAHSRRTTLVAPPSSFVLVSKPPSSDSTFLTITITMSLSPYKTAAAILLIQRGKIYSPYARNRKIPCRRIFFRLALSFRNNGHHHFFVPPLKHNNTTINC